MQLRLNATIAFLTISIQVESFGATAMERNKVLEVEKSFLYTEYSQDGQPVNRMYPILLNNPETKSDASVSLGFLYPGIGFTGVGLAMMGYSAAGRAIDEGFDRDFLMFGTGVFETGGLAVNFLYSGAAAFEVKVPTDWQSQYNPLPGVVLQAFSPDTGSGFRANPITTRGQPPCCREESISPDS